MLCARDGFLIEENEFKNHKVNNEQKYDSKLITLMKVPILNYIYYTYLETEKMSDEIFKCIPHI